MPRNIRKIIKINPDLCNGCGLCVAACHEGAIALVNGKAVLAGDWLCDGLGACLPTCPTGALTIETRNADDFIAPDERSQSHVTDPSEPVRTWPLQLKLVSPYFGRDHADLLIAADCTAYSCPDFHSRYMAGRVTVIACPKLDMCDYTEKLTEIFANNTFNSVTLVRMVVPCCGGLERAIRAALEQSGCGLDLNVNILSIPR